MDLAPLKFIPGQSLRREVPKPIKRGNVKTDFCGSIYKKANIISSRSMTFFKCMELKAAVVESCAVKTDCL